MYLIFLSNPSQSTDEEQEDEDDIGATVGGASLVASTFILAKAMFGSTLVTMPMAYQNVGNHFGATTIFLITQIFICYLTVCLIAARTAHKKIVGAGGCRKILFFWGDFGLWVKKGILVGEDLVGGIFRILSYYRRDYFY